MTTREAIAKANQLRAICVELVAAKARYWEEYRTLGEAVEAATTHETWWVARNRYRAHYRREAPQPWDAIQEWRKACYAASKALSHDAGLEIAEVIE